MGMYEYIRKLYELHRLLGTLLSNELTAKEKLNIIGNEYDIPIEEKFREEVDIMCSIFYKNYVQQWYNN